MPDWSHLNPVERSAAMTLLWRAIESRRVDRLFVDELAEQAAALFPPWPPSPLSNIFANIVALRTSQLDKLVAQAVAGGMDQIVVIGAGMDTRFGRLNLPASATIIELDSKAVNALALEVLPSIPMVQREVALVPGGVVEALKRTTHAFNRATLWIVEGVLEYLPGQLWKRLAEIVTEHSATGSRAFITVLGETLPAIFTTDPTFPFKSLPSLDRVVSVIPDGWSIDISTSAVFRDVPPNAFFIISLNRSEFAAV